MHCARAFDTAARPTGCTHKSVSICRVRAFLALCVYACIKNSAPYTGISLPSPRARYLRAVTREMHVADWSVLWRSLVCFDLCRMQNP